MNILNIQESNLSTRELEHQNNLHQLWALHDILELTSFKAFVSSNLVSLYLVRM